MTTRLGVLVLAVVLALAAALGEAFVPSPSSPPRLGYDCSSNGLGHHASSRTPMRPSARASGLTLMVAVTSWEAQEAQGFVQPPPAVATLVARVQGKVEGEPLLFEETLKAIDANYDYTPKRFVNGDLESAEGANAGSCKVLSMGILHGLDPATLIKLFGEHYRSVLKTPTGSDHGNIRNLMTKGWKGVAFPDGLGLAPKK